MESKTLVLLKRNGIYLVVNGNGDKEHDEYFYNEHTCPTNYIQDGVEAVIYEKDADPHGVFEWVATIDKPEDWDYGPEEFEEWCKLFPELKED